MEKSHFNNLKGVEEKERYLVDLCKKLIDDENYKDALDFIKSSQSLWSDLSTARLTKIIKNLLESVPVTIRNYENVLLLLNGLIEWSEDKKMLKLDLECKLIQLYLTVGKYNECLNKITKVFKDLKKYDDKTNLITLYVTESRAFYELQDFSRAKASLTSARAMAVSFVCPISLQAQIDLLNGMYLSDDQCFDTSISYFIESFDGFYQEKQTDGAKLSLRYILLNKIMMAKYDEVNSVLESKSYCLLKDDPIIQLLCHISKVCKKRDLKQYSDLLSNNRILIENDRFIYKHLNSLYNILLDMNILKIIEPYSDVKIDYIAEKLGFSSELIESKLRNMILDKEVYGILDHLSQCLLLYSHEKSVEHAAVQNIKALSEYFE